MSFSAQLFGDSQGAPMASQNQGQRRQEEKQLSLPVTIRAIEVALKGAEGDELRFHGAVVPETLILVAAVESVVRQPSSIELVVSDATGRLRVRSFASGDATAGDFDEIVPGRYVRMFGSMRQAPAVHFAALAVRPVKSADEVSFHVIEAAHAALRLARGPKPPAAAAPLAQAPTLSVPTAPAAAAPPPAEGGAPAPGGAGELSGAALREAVLAFLQKAGEGKPEGVHSAEICKNVPGAPGPAVVKCLQDLVVEGEAFTTLDDNTFSVDV